MARKTSEELKAIRAAKQAKVMAERFEEDSHIVTVRYDGPSAAENDRARWENNGYRVASIEKLGLWKSWSLLNALILGMIFPLIGMVIYGFVGGRKILVTYKKNGAAKTSMTINSTLQT